MNDENLRTLSPSEAREYGRRGGVRSGEVRRQRKLMKEYLEVALVEDTEYRGHSMTNAEAVTAALVRRAKTGDVRAYAQIVAMLGEKPAERVAVEQTIPPERYAEIEALLMGGADSE